MSVMMGESATDESLFEKTEIFLPRRSTNNIPSTLKTLCLAVVRQNFGKLAKKLNMFPTLLEEVLSETDPSLAFSVDEGARNIEHEGFWKRETRKYFPESRCQMHSNGIISWKRYFLEKIVAQTLGFGKKREITLSGGDLIPTIQQDYIFTLDLQNIRSSPRVGNFLSALPNIMSLNLQYGKTDVKPRIFGGMQTYDVNYLVEALKCMRCLCSLSLTNNQLDDDLVRSLVGQLHQTNIRGSLIDLDLSHNKITTEGLRLITQYFLSNENEGSDDKNDPILSSLKIGGNLIRAEGARTVGRILKTNKSLVTLDLRMNRLQDDGGKLLVDGLLKNHHLRHLNLSSNSVSRLTVRSICTLLENAPDCRMENIDLSSSVLSEEDYNRLASAMQHTSRLISMDLRNSCDFTMSEGLLEGIKRLDRNNKLQL